MNIGYARSVGYNYDSVEHEDHFIFECPIYRFLRTVEYPDLFVGRHSLCSFMDQANH
jgi:hypothetical protein